METRGSKRLGKLAEWHEKVVACRNSGMAVTKWCGEDQIGSGSFYYRELEVSKTLTAAGQTPAPYSAAASPVPAFAHVPVPARQQDTQRAITASIRIGDVETDIYSGADVDVVAAICQVLRSC